MQIASIAPTSRTALVFALTVAVACGDDVALSASSLGDEGTGDTTPGTTSASGAAADTGETGDAEETGGADGGISPPCGYEGMLAQPGSGTYQLTQLPLLADDSMSPGFLFSNNVNNPPESCADFWDPGAGFDDPFGLGAADGFEVFIYHPQDSEGDWPEDMTPRPAVFFSPGNNYVVVASGTAGDEPNHHRYLPLIERLVEAGFVVFGVQPAALTTTSGKRRTQLACVMQWALDGWVESDRLAPYGVLMGHSRGGSGAYMLADHMLSGTSLPTGTALDEWDRCALVNFAPNYGDESETFVGPLEHVDAPPFLSMLGASDDDTNVKGIKAYDNRWSEAAEGLDFYDEVLLSVHRSVHETWGGNNTVAFDQPPNPTGPFYAERFLRWQMLGDDQARRVFMDLVDNDVDSCAFESLPFYDEPFTPGSPADCDAGTNCYWDGINGMTELHYRGCDGADPPAPCGANGPQLVGMRRPLVRAEFGQGIAVTGAERYVVDSMEGEFSACELLDAGDQLLPSTSGGHVTLTSQLTEAGPCVCQLPHDVDPPQTLSVLGGLVDSGSPDACDPATDLAAPGTLDDNANPATTFGPIGFAGHDGDGMVVRFGGPFGPATVRWSLNPVPIEEGRDDGAFDVTGYTHLVARIGNVVVTPPNPPTSCTEVDLDEFNVGFELEDADDDIVVHEITVGPFVESEQQPIGPGGGCRSSNFMQTVRIPLVRFAEAGMFDPTMVNAILLHFDDPDFAHVALVDSIEFVRDPDGAALVPACSEETPPAFPEAAPSAWDCEATTTLVATETSCDTEPVSGACPSGHTVTTAVDLPLVDEGTTGEFEGWVVHVPRGWIADPDDPSTAELADITARCVSACEQQYSLRPEIAATCSATGAFATPTLRNHDDARPRVSIADNRADGSGLFTNASLACDLRDDCVAAFDEDLAIAPPRRPTSQREPVGLGQEWQIGVSGSVYATSPDAAGSVGVALSGTIGFSHCAAGNASASCPFHLGSLALDTTNPLTLALTCDGQTETHVLDDMHIELAQPAMGIAPAASNWRGFPDGALVLSATGIVDGESFSTSGPARRDFKLNTDGAGFVQLLGANGAYLELTVPCGEGTSEVLAWMQFQSSQWLGSPPVVAITVADNVTCPSTVNLTKTISDANNDITEVRWWVDGVLLDEAVTAIPFTTAHTLTARVRDARGATRTKTKTVNCL